MDRPYLFLAVPILVLIAAVVMRFLQPHPAVIYMKTEDGTDPLKRWARGCYSILFGQESPDRRGWEFCVSVINDSWEIHTGEEAFATIQRLSRVPSGEVAWDLVRLVVVARLAAGARLIPMDQAQAAVAAIQRRLQDSYRGWEEVAAAYGVMVRKEGFDDSHLPRARPAAREIWKLVPFK
jgi:hypothetical protein